MLSENVCVKRGFGASKLWQDTPPPLFQEQHTLVTGKAYLGGVLQTHIYKYLESSEDAVRPSPEL